ncbi:MAG: hypothetical protein IJT97_08285, partial [Bacteroidaceae bacterium]|nr:hypothetical protein [Bacteroidaceae bacterium]
TENLYLCGWKGVQVNPGRGLMATPRFFVVSGQGLKQLFFRKGFYARVRTCALASCMHARPFHFFSVNPEQQNARIATWIFKMFKPQG